MVSSYTERPYVWRDVDRKLWIDPTWQNQHAIHSLAGLQEVFPNLSEGETTTITEWGRRGFRFRLTPYLLSLVGYDARGNPLADDPIWRQTIPILPEMVSDDPDEYRPTKENWEMKAEMATPILQHKYPDRAIVYITDTCLAYCGYCFRSLPSTAPEERHGGEPHWQATLAYLREHGEIWEVILSGGDPFVLTNDRLDQLLTDLRSIPHIESIRIHSRAWGHNPYRLDTELCQIMGRHRVTMLSVHLAHPNELTEEVAQAVDRVRLANPKVHLRSQTPLIRNINDDHTTFQRLLKGFTLNGITPYYLYHMMPNVPAARCQRTSVRRGAQLMQAIERHQSGITMPHYVIVGRTGKKTVLLVQTDDFIYTTNDQGWPTVDYIDWKGTPQTYLDSPD